MFDSVTPPQAAFLIAYCTGKSLLDVTKSARAARIDRHTHYYWLTTSAEYKAAFNEAEQHARDILIAEATRAALEGDEELVIYAGAPVMIPTGRMVPHPDGKVDRKTHLPVMVPQMRPLTRRKRSVRLHLALLAALDPTRFSTKRVEHSGTVNVNLSEKVAEARKRLALSREARSGAGE